MTTEEIIINVFTIIISLLALVISSITAYKTIWARFQGMVYPKLKPVLIQIDGTPVLIMECVCINQGAKPGSIETMLVRMYDRDRVAPFDFRSYMSRDQFNILGDYKIEDFSPFTGLWLDANQRKEIFIAFAPTQEYFKPQAGTVSLSFSICTEVRKGKKKGKWIKSPTYFSLILNDYAVEQWMNPEGRPIQIEAKEIGESILEHLAESYD